jgi:hypothetical protein
MFCPFVVLVIIEVFPESPLLEIVNVSRLASSVSSYRVCFLCPKDVSLINGSAGLLLNLEVGFFSVSWQVANA